MAADKVPFLKELSLSFCIQRTEGLVTHSTFCLKILAWAFSSGGHLQLSASEAIKQHLTQLLQKICSCTDKKQKGSPSQA
jgi:hypothetical protein